MGNDDIRDRWQKAIDYSRVRRISDDYNDGFNLTHTLHMIHYVEGPPIGEDERKDNLLRIVSELRLVHKDCASKIEDTINDHILNLMDCARNDILKQDYWAAISDISWIEGYYMQKHLPHLPILDDELQPYLLFAKKLIKDMGGTMWIEKNKKELPIDPADWWKNQ